MSSAIASVGSAALVMVTAAAASPPQLDGPEIRWAYPGGATPEPAMGWDKTRAVALYGPSSAHTEAQIHDLSHAVDWRPHSHPVMPDVVANGHPPEVSACGFCHLPAGEGRPENASLAGLPRDYIIRQVGQFATGARASEVKGWGPSATMSKLASHTTEAEAAAAADYFSRLAFRSHVRVVEAASVPKPTATNFLLAPGVGEPREPLGARIVEGPRSMERFERRDPLIAYVAYVPLGSLKRGAELAVGSGGTQVCSDCHGPGLKGGPIGPPLAGRSPSYLFRQLHAFKSGARSGPDAAPMRAVTAQMSMSDMIALAAYAGSKKP